MGWLNDKEREVALGRLIRDATRPDMDEADWKLLIRANSNLILDLFIELQELKTEIKMLKEEKTE